MLYINLSDVDPSSSDFRPTFKDLGSNALANAPVRDGFRARLHSWWGRRWRLPGGIARVRIDVVQTAPLDLDSAVGRGPGLVIVEARPRAVTGAIERHGFEPAGGRISASAWTELRRMIAQPLGATPPSSKQRKCCAL